ncbi:MAG: hypothetical protein ACJ8IQ_08870 [Chthoniobacterales bacterium]
MRAEHVTAAEIQAYAARQLTAEDALEISDHLVACAECRAVIRQAERLRGSHQKSTDLSYEELADFLDEKLDPPERHEVMQKLALSRRARQELDDLAQFRNDVATASQRESPRRFRWATWSLPIAAAFAAGVGFLWWSVTSQPREGGLVLRDNGLRLQLTPNGSLLGGPDLPPELRASLKSALSQNRLDVPPTLALLRGETGNLAAAPTNASTFNVVSPIATAVADVSPELRWTADAQASGYRITVAQNSDGTPVASADISKEQLSWRPSTPLKRGETYVWQVQALQNDNVIATAPAPPQPEARFRVLSDEQAQDLESLTTRVGHSHLALALAYARSGVIDKADTELSALETENRDSAVPGQLRAALRNAAASSH